MLEYDILMPKVDLSQIIFNVLKSGRRFHGSIPRVKREVAWADALTRSVVCSHLSDHPEHPYGHVIEKERLPPPPAAPRFPAILTLLESDGWAVDAADLRQGRFPSSAV